MEYPRIKGFFNQALKSQYYFVFLSNNSILCNQAEKQAFSVQRVFAERVVGRGTPSKPADEFFKNARDKKCLPP